MACFQWDTGMGRHVNGESGVARSLLPARFPPVSDFGTTCSRATTDVPCGRRLDAEGKQFSSPGRLARYLF
jgi:hypothetical protein